MTKCLMLLHPLANFKIKKYYQNELRFNGVYSKHSLLVVPRCVAQKKDKR